MNYRTGLFSLGMAVGLAMLLHGPGWCQPPDSESNSSKHSTDAHASAEKLVVTHHRTTIDGNEIEYTATTGKMALKNDEGEVQAHAFFIAYTRNGEKASQRPISFCFNGGPGSSSVWLHLGMLGPKRVRMPDDATPLKPPYRLHHNPHSMLDKTDLVFIDPISTGYSRPVDPQKKTQFHGYDEDIRSVAQFIHDYTTKFQRWTSAKFLIGESYGGVRAAGLAGQLRDRYKLELNGLVVVSGVINFQTLRFSTGNDLPYPLFLPTYTATAWYHQALPGDLQNKPLREVVAESEEFAAGPYAAALMKGTKLPTAERKAIVEKLARLTGLSREYVDGADLRISMSRFGKELLRKRQLTVGRFDGRYVGRDRDNVGESYEYDASGAAIFGPFTAGLNDYVRGTLKYEDDRVYEILTGAVHPWSYRRFENRYVNASESLREAMTANPYLKLFAACGYYDLATPHFAMDYTLDHLGLAKDLRDNITVRYYEAGHMMYIHEPSLKQLRVDLVKFYAEAQ